MPCNADPRSDMAHEPIINERPATGRDGAGGYVSPISFQELHQAGRLSMPFAEEYAEGYGPLGDTYNDGSTVTDSTDPLEAFVDVWAHAGPSPASPILP